MLKSLFWIEGMAIAGITGMALYCLISQRNLFKILIGLNVLSKAAILALAIGSVDTGHVASGQSLMISVMLVEVTVTAVALSLVVNVYKHYGSFDTRDLRRLSS